MNIHYLKVAFRNLWKYRTQNIISILGLAAGFICFALSALWIRYELTYDDFHDGADRIYNVSTKFSPDPAFQITTTPRSLGGELEKNYPEIESSCFLLQRQGDVEREEHVAHARWLVVDSSFLRMFRVKVIAGNIDFSQSESGQIALTESYARTLFPEGKALGQKVKINGMECEVRAIVKEWNGHSTIPYDLLRSANTSSLTGYAWTTFLKLKPHIDTKSFIERLQKAEIQDYSGTVVLTRLTEQRRNESPKSKDAGYLQLTDLRLFFWAGALLIIGALLNYWGVFSSLLRIRRREMALRMVNGSSWYEIWKLLCTDVLILLGISLIIGMVGIELLMPKFIELAQIESSRSDIYREILLYFGIVLFTALVFLAFSVYNLRRNSLYHTLSRKTSERDGKNYFRKGCLLLQLIISLGFIFCTTIMLKQVHYLKHTDIGLIRENRVTLIITEQYAEPILRKIKQIPQVVRLVDKGSPLFPQVRFTTSTLDEWEGKPEDMKEAINVRLLDTSTEMLDFYGIRIIEGQMPDFATEDHAVLINETLARQLRVTHPIGLSFLYPKMVVKGIVADFYSESPTSPPQAMLFTTPQKDRPKEYAEVALEYKGDWKECKEAIERISQTMYPDESNLIRMRSADEEYEKFLKSELHLINLLSIVSGVCILICIFGVYSLTALQCEQRRKEIAIRKVNGAKASNILHMFFLEYMWILLGAAVIVFPLGTILMRRWVEKYTLQTSFAPWVYLIILIAVAIALYGSIVWRVGRAARQNPAEVIKMNQ